MNRPARYIYACLLIFCALGYAVAGDYIVDPVHSRVGFKISHMTISTVSGQFDTFNGNISFEKGKVADLTIEAEIEVASINTSNKRRDDHLRSDDFFAADKHPKMTFKSKKVTRVADGKATLQGDLTMRGVTKSVTMDITVAGPVKNNKGKDLIALTMSGKLNRRDFGINYGNAATLGDEVTLDITVEAISK